MRFFPVFLDLDHQPVLVVGGGEQAAQKIRLLAKTKARIRVLAPEPCAEIAGLAAAGAVTLEPRPLAARDLAGVRLAYVALDDDAEAARAVAMGRAAGVPVNAVDRQELCDFITPAIVDRDPVVVAIGTEGTAPVLARQIKARLEAMLPARLGGLARWAASLRAACGRCDRRGQRAAPVLGRLLRRAGRPGLSGRRPRRCGSPGRARARGRRVHEPSVG